MEVLQRKRLTHKPYFLPILLAVVFGAAGVIALMSARAATPTASVEVEGGTKTASVAAVSDSAASGSSAVKFSAASTGGGTGVCDTYPALPSVKPDASNSGVPSGTTLTTYSGPTTITTAGTVVDGKIINNDLIINANNVTIKNSRITGGGYYVVSSNATSGVKLINNEISSSSGGTEYIGVIGKYELICGNYIHGFENGMSMYSGGATIQANYLDKMGGGASAHHDGIEVYGGSNYKIWGNNIRLTGPSGAWITETGAINISDDSSVINNVELNGNWLGGGSFTLYVDDQFAYSISGVKLTNNTFYGTAPAGYAGYGPMLIRTGSTVTQNTGNKWENGTSL